MSGFSQIDLTCDPFLGGRLHLVQPRHGYRAGIDPLLLAAVVPARAGQSVLDLGCGVGCAALALGTRVTGLDLVGVEVQADYADLARRNGAENAVPLEVVTADLAALPAALRRRQFDHVIANPPYFHAARTTAAPDPGRDMARAEQTPLEDWIDTAARRVRPGGFVHMIQRMDRLPDLLRGCDGRLGSVEILPLAGRAGRAPHLVLLRARKGGRAAFLMLAPKILHQGATHDGDRDSYCAEISAVLRAAAPLSWGPGAPTPG